MTYNEFKEKLEELVLAYAMECDANLDVKVTVEKDFTKYDCGIQSIDYDVKTETNIK